MQYHQTNKYIPITIALAGAFQTGYLIHELATTGTCDENAFFHSINSIYKIDADSVADVYDGTQNITSGLQVLTRIFSSSRKKIDTQTSHYALSMLFLQYKLIQRKEVWNELRKRIVQVTNQAKYFSPTHDMVINNLADILQYVITKLRFQMQFVGKKNYLQNDATVNKMRSLLLAGLRSAVLWRQMGGRRWQLFFARKKMLATAKEILNEIK